MLDRSRGRSKNVQQCFGNWDPKSSWMQHKATTAFQSQGYIVARVHCCDDNWCHKLENGIQDSHLKKVCDPKCLKRSIRLNFAPGASKGASRHRCWAMVAGGSTSGHEILLARAWGTRLAHQDLRQVILLVVRPRCPCDDRWGQGGGDLQRWRTPQMGAHPNSCFLHALPPSWIYH